MKKQVGVLNVALPWSLGLLALLSGLMLGCGASADGEERGELIVALTSDMPVPDDITDVQMEVFGSRSADFDTLTWSGPVDFREEPGEIPLPATLALVSGTDPSRPVKVMVRAYQEIAGERYLRLRADRVTTAPKLGKAVLQIPMEWLCTASAQDVSDVDTLCPDGQTCIAGVCESNVVNLADLPSYDDWVGAQPAGSCFDAKGCFENVNLYSIVNSTSCLMDYPNTDVGVNFAMVLSDKSAGVCNDSGKCWVVLDYGTQTGWRESPTSGRVVQLPRRVCELHTLGKLQGVAVTTSCPTKTPSIGLCR